MKSIQIFLIYTPLLISCCTAKKQNQPFSEEVDLRPSTDTLVSTQEEAIVLKDTLRSKPVSVEPKVNTFDGFVPEGFEIMHQSKGDLNRDAYEDALLVLRHQKEDSISTREEWVKRPLLILSGKEDGQYLLANRCDYAVLCKTCGGVFGDPFEGITIKNGYFSLEHYGGSNWRWTRIITFKYNAQEKNWFLHKDGGDSYHSSVPDQVETDVQTVKDFGTVAFEAFHAGD